MNTDRERERLLRLIPIELAAESTGDLWRMQEWLRVRKRLRTHDAAVNAGTPEKSPYHLFPVRLEQEQKFLARGPLPC